MKRFLVLLLVISIAIIPFGAAAFADQSASKIVSEEPLVRGMRCDSCGEYTLRLVSTTVTADWAKTGKKVDCTHGYWYGDDYEEVRRLLKTYKCSNCPATVYSSYNEYHWICDGHN